jgi:(p)ppGpp synthase/HD superfamily hydrolase
LRQGSASAIRVSLADKVHNARSIVADLRRVGDAIWSRFTATREECLWYYDSLLEVFRQASPSPLVGELAAQVADMVKLARE